MGGSQSLSGETVTEATALTYSAIWNAISLYSGTISTLPLHLLRQNQQKTLHAEEKPLYRILHDNFNPFMTAQVSREVMMSHILLWGNCYCEIVRNGVGDIVELWPISPDRVRPYYEDGQVFYEIRVDSQKVILPREKVLHVPGLGFDGLIGYSVVGMARKSFGLSMALESFGALYFGQGTHVGCILSHPGKLDDKARANLTESFAGIDGLAKSHKKLILEEGMKLEKIGIPPEDSQFLQSRQFQIAEIARWYNLPPHRLKDLSRSSFSNIASEQISFVTDSVLPWLVRFEQNYNMQLLTQTERYKQKMFFRHNVDGLLRGDPATRAEYYKSLFGIGVYSINEIRELEGRDPIENGDERFVPLNMLPLSKIDEYLTQQKSSNQSTAIPEPKPVEAPKSQEPAKNISRLRLAERPGDPS
jgi:HK97 family phage portal protein